MYLCVNLCNGRDGKPPCPFYHGASSDGAHRIVDCSHPKLIAGRVVRKVEIPWEDSEHLPSRCPFREEELTIGIDEE